MPLESMQLYSCPVCGNSKCGIEWEDSPSSTQDKEYQCESCSHDLNEDELYSED